MTPRETAQQRADEAWHAYKVAYGELVTRYSDEAFDAFQPISDRYCAALATLRETPA